MTTETEVPMLAEYFILSLMRLDRDHYQRVEAVRSVTGDDMEHFLFAPNGELENLILDYLGFPADGTPIKGGGKFTRNAWDWEYHEMLEGGLPATDVLARMKREVAEAREITIRSKEFTLPEVVTLAPNLSEGRGLRLLAWDRWTVKSNNQQLGRTK